MLQFYSAPVTGLDAVKFRLTYLLYPQAITTSSSTPGRADGRPDAGLRARAALPARRLDHRLAEAVRAGAGAPPPAESLDAVLAALAEPPTADEANGANGAP